MIEQENWLPVVGYEGWYEVSDQGRLRSVPRCVPCKGGKTRQLNQRIMRPSQTRTGYMVVKLSRNHVSRSMGLHPLVLQAFVGPRPLGMECCHADGDKTNNALSNLRWDTKRANELDAIRLGTRPDPNRTACGYGHELTETNVYFTKARPETRQCKRCLSVYNARARAKRKAMSAGTQ